jgi:hypothetical protein
MPPKDIYSPFADPNSFLARPFLPALGQTLSQGAGNIARGEEEFRTAVLGAGSRALSGLGRTAMTLGSAYMAPITAARRAVSGTPLISGTALGRPRQQQPAEQVVAPPVTAFTQPSAPQPAAPSFQAPPVTAFTTAPSAASVGQNLVTQRPVSRTVLTYGLANPPMATGTSSYRQISTPYGTIYASNQAGENQAPSQAQTFASRSTAFEGRTPEQQQTLLAKARQGGRDIAQDYATTMTNFANRNISSPVNLAAPQGRFGQPLVGNFPRSKEGVARAEQAVSPTSPLASMGNAPSFPFMEERNRNPFSSIYGFQS